MDKQYNFCNGLLLSMQNENNQLRSENRPDVRMVTIKKILSGFATLNPIIKNQISELRKTINQKGDVWKI